MLKINSRSMLTPGHWKGKSLQLKKDYIQLNLNFSQEDIHSFLLKISFHDIKHVMKYCEKIVKKVPLFNSFSFNAFSRKWRYCRQDWFSQTTSLYCFPPFSLIGRLLQKVRQDQAEVFLVAPLWTTQNFYTSVLEMLIQDPYIVKVGHKTLTLPQTQKTHRGHPLVNKLHLMLCRISGNPSKAEIYRKNLLTSSWRHGENLPKSNIPHILEDGFSSVIKPKLIQFKPL